MRKAMLSNPCAAITLRAPKYSWV